MAMSNEAHSDPRLQELVAALLTRFPQIKEIYLLGPQAGGFLRQEPDFRILLYADYDDVMPLLLALERDQSKLRPAGLVVYVYVEYYDTTLCGLWGAKLLHQRELIDWQQGHEYTLLWSAGGAGQLAQRIQSPTERRVAERRRSDRRRAAQVAPSDQRGTDRRELDRRYPDRIQWESPGNLPEP